MTITGKIQKFKIVEAMKKELQEAVSAEKRFLLKPDLYIFNKKAQSDFGLGFLRLLCLLFMLCSH